MKITREENGRRINNFWSRNKMNVFLEIYQINQVDLARVKINQQTIYNSCCCIVFLFSYSPYFIVLFCFLIKSSVCVKKKTPLYVNFSLCLSVPNIVSTPTTLVLVDFYKNTKIGWLFILFLDPKSLILLTFFLL